MKNLIFIPFAFKTGVKTGANIHKKENGVDIYCKNLCVSLVSAKRQNPNDDVALVTNLDIPKDYEAILSKNNIMTIKIPFDEFVFDKDYKWGLAFYKLCALSHIVREYDYDNYAYMDADTYVQRSFENIWKECEYSILMYDINYGLHIKDYGRICAQLKDFDEKLTYPTQYGGEFFAANRKSATQFSEECMRVYKQMIERKFVTTMGDEFIATVAANNMKKDMKNAGAYIFRFWTGSFRYISTCYEQNAIAILHVPDEKEGGMVKLYDKYIRKGKTVKREKVHKILHLKHRKTKTFIKNLMGKYIRDMS